MGRAHKNVVGDFAKRYSQVDDIILCAAAFREVADVNDAACCGISGWKWLQMINKRASMDIALNMSGKILQILNI